MFGSARNCPGVEGCTVGSSDVDLVVVHPPGSERLALDLRRQIGIALGARDLLAEVVVLSTREVESTGFWRDEGVCGLRVFVDSCNRRALKDRL